MTWKGERDGVEAGLKATSFLGSYISPPYRARGKEDPCRGWSHDMVTISHGGRVLFAQNVATSCRVGR